jgi:hypothetical protein
MKPPHYNKKATAIFKTRIFIPKCPLFCGQVPFLPFIIYLLRRVFPSLLKNRKRLGRLMKKIFKLLNIPKRAKIKRADLHPPSLKEFFFSTYGISGNPWTRRPSGRYGNCRRACPGTSRPFASCRGAPSFGRFYRGSPCSRTWPYGTRG